MKIANREATTTTFIAISLPFLPSFIALCAHSPPAESRMSREMWGPAAGEREEKGEAQEVKKRKKIVCLAIYTILSCVSSLFVLSLSLPLFVLVLPLGVAVRLGKSLIAIICTFTFMQYFFSWCSWNAFLYVLMLFILYVWFQFMLIHLIHVMHSVDSLYIHYTFCTLTCTYIFLFAHMICAFT